MNPYSKHTEIFFPPKVKRHLRPFYPYLNKYNTCTHALEYRADEEPHAIKLQTIRTWIKTCEKTHDNHCVSSNAKAFGQPLWLIDISRNCIVPYAQQQYVALSYVWGATDCASLTLDTLETLQKDKSLSSVTLAKTITDAIDLTARLGQHFLWVDRVCIVQDDMTEKKHQIQSMRAVYAGAYFTIVAAQGLDASQPLHGGYLDDEQLLHPICVQGSRRRHGSQGQLFGTVCDRGGDHSGLNGLPEEGIDENVKKLTGKDFEATFLENGGVVDDIIGGMSWEDDPYSPSGGSPPDYYSTDKLKEALEGFGPETWQRLISEGIMQRLAVELTQSTWYSRGWTFQEYLFSPRKLVFHANTVNWDCHCASWHENQMHISSQPCFSREKDDIFGMDTNSWPNMYRLIRLICLFNRRSLTHPEDVLDAFEGPLQSFRATFQDGFVAGLPQMFFDAALLWQPYSPLTRRQYTGPSNPESALPSWSWIGWQGNLHSESWLAGFDYTLGQNGWSGAVIPSSTISTVKWSWSVSERASKNEIIVSADEYRSRYSDGQHLLPEGWSVEGNSHKAFFFNCPEAHQPFGHPFKDKYQPFKYPIPTVIGNQPLAPSSRAGFLHGRTRRASFKIKGLMSYRPSVRHGCITATLTRDCNQVVGYLRLNEDADNAETKVGDTCDLIELSSGSTPGSEFQDRTHELDWEGGTSFLDMKTFINVMSVNWKDGIAYRKAVGRVHAHIWRGAGTVEIDVILG